MPDLLETIAETDTAVLSGWAATFNETRPQIDALPLVVRQRELLTLAREFTRRAAWAADTADGWLAELMTRLRAGMGGHTLRDLLRGGRELCRTCQSVVEIAGDVWRLAESAGAELGQVRAAADVLAAVRARVAAVETRVEAFAKRAPRPTPEMIAELFQRAEASAPARPSLTLEQALAAVRKSD